MDGEQKRGGGVGGIYILRCHRISSHAIAYRVTADEEERKKSH